MANFTLCVPRALCSLDKCENSISYKIFLLSVHANSTNNFQDISWSQIWKSENTFLLFLSKLCCWFPTQVLAEHFLLLSLKAWLEHSIKISYNARWKSSLFAQVRTIHICFFPQSSPSFSLDPSLKGWEMKTFIFILLQQQFLKCWDGGMVGGGGVGGRVPRPFQVFWE